MKKAIDGKPKIVLYTKMKFMCGKTETTAEHETVCFDKYKARVQVINHALKVYPESTLFLIEEQKIKIGEII